MREVSEKEVKIRLAFDNPWWGEQGGVDPQFREWPRRAYFDAFSKLVADTSVRRAVVLMGPRRVGKTVMILQTIQLLIDGDTDPKSIFYASLDTPVYFGLPLEIMLKQFLGTGGHNERSHLYVFFDEIQYHKDWEVHLKSLVDSYPTIRFVGSGSAAAALRMKSRESGAGRFTDFILPPLLFSEYLRFRGIESRLVEIRGSTFHCNDTSGLNSEFVNYLNFGGYPEAVLSETIRNNSERYIRSDIIEKVLLRDLPSLYGVSDVQELNRLFTTLAYNTAGELSLEGLSKSSGVAKNTLRRYLEYLEAAFLIFRVNRVDRKARRFKRALTFKCYLTNASMHAALFGAVSPDSDAMGRLAETAVFAQLSHSDLSQEIYYARWKGGEIDLISIDPASQRPVMAVEIKWSDRQVNNPAELKHFVKFCKENSISPAEVIITTRTRAVQSILEGFPLRFNRTSLFCYMIGKSTVEPLLDRGIHPYRYIRSMDP